MIDFEKLREEMVKNQIINEGIYDKKIIKAMLKVKRHEFVPDELKPFAYNDTPLPIGEGQTISQPFIVAYMTEQLHIFSEDRVLEIGTGSGYQTAILAELSKSVYTVELNCNLQKRAMEILSKNGYNNIYFKCDDGKKGWEEHAPYDKIMVTAAPANIPKALFEQLKERGRMIIPIGTQFQYLYLVEKINGNMTKKKLLPVLFVPFR